jgi:hypothetical protein
MIKKIFLAGVLAGVAMLVVNVVVSFIFPSLRAEYLNINVFRPWSDPVMQLYYLEPFLAGILLAWFWKLVKAAFPNGRPARKALAFGASYWLVATIPGMLITYASFQVSFGMVLSWTLTGLVQAILAMFVIVRFNPDTPTVA